MQESIALSTVPPYSGLAMVLDANKAFQTVATQFSGPTDPAGLAGAYMLWADTASGMLKRRNAANNAWVVVGRLFADPTGGRLLNARLITSTQVYNATAGTALVIVEGVGAGGTAGGAAATGAGTYSIGTAGKAASYGMGLFTSGFSGVLATIGAAGAAVVGGNGGNGGTTSFGPLLSIPGGGGGSMFGPTGSAVIAGNSGATPSPSGANLKSIQGAEPQLSILQPGGLSLAAGGANGPWGNGGRQLASSGDGVGALGFGAGGGAAFNMPSQPARPGGVGSPGALLVWEYA